jgi:hypothetical protein
MTRRVDLARCDLDGVVRNMLDIHSHASIVTTTVTNPLALSLNYDLADSSGPPRVH